MGRGTFVVSPKCVAGEISIPRRREKVKRTVISYVQKRLMTVHLLLWENIPSLSA